MLVRYMGADGSVPPCCEFAFLQAGVPFTFQLCSRPRPSPSPPRACRALGRVNHTRKVTIAGNL